MAGRRDEDWDEGPSISLGGNAEAEEEPAEFLEERPRPKRVAEDRSVPPKPRSPLWVRLLYVLIFCVLVLTSLVVYALVSRDRTERLLTHQDQVWAPRLGEMEKRWAEVEERVKVLEEKLQVSPPARKK